MEFERKIIKCGYSLAVPLSQDISKFLNLNYHDVIIICIQEVGGRKSLILWKK